MFRGEAETYTNTVAPSTIETANMLANQSVVAIPLQSFVKYEDVSVTCPEL